MRVNKGVLLRLQYKLSDAKTGELLEETTPDNALIFIHGMGLMLPAFEAQLVGKEPGDKFDFVLTTDQAYGEPLEDYQIGVPKSAFLIDGKFDEERIYEGALVPMSTADGQRVEGVVQSIEGDKVYMDFNHPLAGIPLHFVGEIEEVREPTEEEVHAFTHPHHGCGGCSGHEHGGEGCCGCH